MKSRKFIKKSTIEQNTAKNNMPNNFSADELDYKSKINKKLHERFDIASSKAEMAMPYTVPLNL